jgi:hypothetical protein
MHAQLGAWCHVHLLQNLGDLVPCWPSAAPVASHKKAPFMVFMSAQLQRLTVTDMSCHVCSRMQRDLRISCFSKGAY